MTHKIFILFISGICLLSISSCKSEFEKLRASDDPELLYTKAFEYYENEDYYKAQTLFELIINNLRGKAKAEKVYFYYAYTHFHLRKYITSSYYFNSFSNTFPNSELREEAFFMKGFSNYQLSPTFRLDQTYTEKAIGDFQLFVNTYPNSDRVKQCNNLIDEMRKKLERKAYAEGLLYFDLKQYQSATQTFENLLKDYPESKNAEEVNYLIAKGLFLLAQNSVVDKQEERYRKTIEKSEGFISKYPDSKYSGEVKSYLKNSNKQLKKLFS